MTPGLDRAPAPASRADPPEVRDLHLGFVPLTDSAPLVVAKERGWFRRHGLNVTLHREPSWANLRDKLVAGVFQAAQMLAPMPLATSLGLDGVTAPLVTSLSLGLNGNAITVSSALYERLLAEDPEAMARPPVGAATLRRVIARDRDAGRRPLRFAVVFPYSPHYYELAYWLAAGGVDPTRDVEMVVRPPPTMVRALEEGEIDGCCVGEPWNQLAAATGVGRPIVTKYEIWNNAPEKVLALDADWADAHPATHRALIRALIETAEWLDEPSHRLEAVHVIAGESYVDAPVPVVLRSMSGRLEVGPDPRRCLPDFHVFHRYAATFPWVSHGMFFLAQMLRWGQIEKPIDLWAAARAVIRPDVYREAALSLGRPAPRVDVKREGLHAEPWELPGSDGALRMGPDRFLDGRRFDPADVVSWLEHCTVTNLRVRLDDLAEVNAAGGMRTA